MNCCKEKRETWVAKQNVVLWKYRGEKEETENFEPGTKFHVRYKPLANRNTIGNKTLIFLEKVKKSKTITLSTGSLKQRSAVEVTVDLPASSISIENILIILTNKSPGTLEKSPGWNQR